MADEHAVVGPLRAEDFHKEVGDLVNSLPAQSRRLSNRAALALENPLGFRLFVVRDRTAVVVGALCFDVCALHVCAAGIVSVAAARQVITALHEDFGADFVGLSGCDGPQLAVEALGTACTEEFRCVAIAHAPLETMILESAPLLEIGAPGRLRTVEVKSRLLPTLALWFMNFEKDTENEVFSLNGHKQVIAHLSATAARGDLFVWEVKEKPVAMLILGRLCPKQVLCVYTVPHQRGKGYGQAITASVCARRWQLTGGSEPIQLSAVQEFGASRVYKRIGFRSVGWLHGITFQEASPAADADLLANLMANVAGFGKESGLSAYTGSFDTSVACC